ncbi:response regulator [Blastococcus sp. SYSU D00669]
MDPDRRVRAAVGRLAATIGLAVTAEATGVHEALAAATSGRPALALVEPLLPTFGAGCGLVRELRHGRGIPVVALSTQQGLRPPVLAAGAVEFFAKDCTPEQLLDALRRHCPPGT